MMIESSETCLGSGSRFLRADVLGCVLERLNGRR